MFVSNFYNITAVIIILIIIKISLNQSGFNTLITVTLGCSLSYCFFENGLTFVPLVSYFLKDQAFSYLLFIKELFAAVKKPLNNQKEPSLSKTRSSLDNQLSLPSTPPTPWSPLEKSLVDRDGHSQWANCGIGVGVVVAISHSCIGIARRLDYTQKWKERMIEKRVPKFLFFWVSDLKPEQISEKSFLHFLVIIFVSNLIVLYVLFSTL